MAEHYGESALAAAAEAFVTHLVENRYIGPDTPVSVGLTERNLRNIYSLVVQPNRTAGLQAEQLLDYMLQHGWLEMEGGQVLAFPRHGYRLPAPARPAPRLTRHQRDRLKKLKPLKCGTVVVGPAPGTEGALQLLVERVVAARAGLVVVWGDLEMSAWPGYSVFTRPGLTLLHHTKLAGVVVAQDSRAAWLVVQVGDRVTLLSATQDWSGRVAEMVTILPGLLTQHPGAGLICLVGGRDRKAVTEVWTDGACMNNGSAEAVAGCGVWWGRADPRNLACRAERNTNNSAEIQAAFLAVQQATMVGLTGLKLYTDSQFLVNCMTQWVRGWREADWVRSNGEPVINRAELEALLELLETSELEVVWQWVGRDQNKEADLLARQGAGGDTPYYTAEQVAKAGWGCKLDCKAGEGALLLTSPSAEVEVEWLEGGLVQVTQQTAWCELCQAGLQSNAELALHKLTPRHNRNRIFNYYQQKRTDLLRSPHDLGLELSLDGAPQGVTLGSEEAGVVSISARPGLPVQFKVRLKNVRQPVVDEVAQNEANRPTGIVLERCGLVRPSSEFTLTDTLGLTNEQPTKLRLKYEKRAFVSVVAKAGQVGHYRVPLIVAFYHEIHSDQTMHEGRMRDVLSHVALELLLKVQTPEMAVLGPVAPYRDPPRRPSRWSAEGRAVRGRRLERDTQQDQLRMELQLDQYLSEGAMRNLVERQLARAYGSEEETELERCRDLLEAGPGPGRYAERWGLLLHCEEAQLQVDIRHYDMTGVTLTRENGGAGRKGLLFGLEVPGLEENRPSVMKGDKIYLRTNGDSREFEGIVHIIRERRVLLGLNNKFAALHLPGMLWEARFTVGRFPLRNMHRAVQLAGQDHQVTSLLFPPAALPAPVPAIDLPAVRVFNRLIETNPAQLAAVQQILAGHGGRAPYIVFGPPGTGKTVTMVETIKQVLQLPGTRVVAAAPSNTAADLLAERLLDHLGRGKLLRLHAASRQLSAVPERLKSVSNIGPDGVSFPSLEKLCEYRVVVTTLVTAGRLVSARFPADHFSHVFLDEAGQATEPEAVVAVAGLLGPAGRLVMAGDPRQLGPVVRSQLAVKNGLATSLLERLMELGLYISRDPRCITKLVKNFRSHPALLTVPKRLFYDNELEACADPVVTESCLAFPGLPDQARANKVPLIFHGVVGQDLKEETSPSFFNPEEIVIVMDYVKKILEMNRNRVQKKEIGVIAPYRRQVQKLRRALERAGLGEVRVGSTEEFQGQERRVIIISTVRSSPEFVNTDTQYKLGFVKNPKRFNVAITRAKALLVVVGNPHILSQDREWGDLLQYSREQGCYTGCQYEPQSDEDMDRLATRMKNMLIDPSQISQLTLMEEPAWRGQN